MTSNIKMEMLLTICYYTLGNSFSVSLCFLLLLNFRLPRKPLLNLLFCFFLDSALCERSSFNEESDEFPSSVWDTETFLLSLAIFELSRAGSLAEVFTRSCNEKAIIIKNIKNKINQIPVIHIFYKYSILNLH